ncbi:MAG: MarR family transcriptional regulator [Burkholderiaceae bacterium]
MAALADEVPARTDATVPGASLRHLVGYAALQVQLQLRDVFLARIGVPFELRPVEFALLGLLADRAPMTQKQLAVALRLKAPNLTVIVERLLARGLLARRRNARDGRSLLVSLTATGRRLQARAHAESLTMEDQALAGLSPSERAQLLDLLWRVGAPGDPIDDQVA